MTERTERLAPMCLFCQAEDGIRGLTVTGVQTCALPISGLLQASLGAVLAVVLTRSTEQSSKATAPVRERDHDRQDGAEGRLQQPGGFRDGGEGVQIGRASCRERGEVSVVGGSFKKKKEW